MYNEKKVIGICTTQLDEKEQAGFLENVVREFSNRDYYTLVFSSDSDLYLNRETDLGSAAIFNLPNFSMIDMMLVFSETIKDKEILNKLIERAKHAGIPLISIEEEIEGVYSVVYDRNTAFEKLVRHVIEYHGLRDVNFITGMQGNTVAEERLDIYKQVLEDNDIAYEESRVGYGDFWSEPTKRVMDDFMAPYKVPPEAIICANDSMAVTVTDYLHEKGYKVPEDILVTGFDGIDDGKLHYPGITTGVRDGVNDAKKIVRYAESILAGEKVSFILELHYRIQLSQSCGCQMNHIFDQDHLLSYLNTEISKEHAAVRRYADLSEEFLCCSTMKELDQKVRDNMPDDSFLCINSDLALEKHGKRQDQGEEIFTPAMNALVKLDGQIYEEQCTSENVIPEHGREVDTDRITIIQPLHFGKEVVGYLGIWREPSGIYDLIRTFLFYLRSLDNSIGYLLANAPREE